VLSTARTSTPLELDQIYKSIDELTVALGPQGANSKGSLTRLLDSTAQNFRGQGEQFHQTISDLGKLTGTLDDNKEELFGTVRQVERFVRALAHNDGTVRRFNDSLASAADLLKDERADLAAALHNLGIAMKAVEGFVKENRGTLSHNIKGLNQVAKVLVKQRAALDEVLQVAPTTLANLYHTYNPSAGTLDTRTNFNENLNALTADPAAALCSIIRSASADNSKQVCSLLGQAFPKARAGALTNGSAAQGTRVVEHIDRSLGGIVEVKR
jgi:phospholipid/cholesterol/gamma-HCH transport system substrate-binding protein